MHTQSHDCAYVKERIKVGSFVRTRACGGKKRVVTNAPTCPLGVSPQQSWLVAGAVRGQIKQRERKHDQDCGFASELSDRRKVD